MNDWGVRFIKFTSFSPIFKGGSVTIVGLIALLFSLWMRWRWKEPLSVGFLIFVGVSIFVTLFGLYILIFQPQWWRLPY